MSTLVEKIKSEQLIARMAKEEIKKNLLTTLLGEASMYAKNDGNRALTDNDFKVVIAKFIKNINESIAHVKGDALDKYLQEKTILLSFLPKQLTNEEAEQIVKKFVSNMEQKNPKMIGQVMAFMKNNYEGQYDSKSLSEIAKRALS